MMTDGHADRSLSTRWQVLDGALDEPSVRASLGTLLASTAGEEGAADVGGIRELAESAMWACSSGLNVRQDWRDGAAVDAVARGRATPPEPHVLAAGRAGVAALSAQQAASSTPAGNGSARRAWMEEASVAAAAMEAAAVAGGGGGAIKTRRLGQAWAVLAPPCRRLACEELCRVLRLEATGAKLRVRFFLKKTYISQATRLLK